MKKSFHLVKGDNRKDVAILLIRLMLGVVFIYHGLPKLGVFGPTDQLVGFFSMIGIPSPAIMLTVAGLAEVLGGVLLILGLFTNLASWVLAFTMLVAVVMAHGSKGFNIMNGGYEYALTLLVMCVALAHLGHGKYSLCKCKCENGTCDAEK